jgi:hypothetical protein
LRADGKPTEYLEQFLRRVIFEVDETVGSGFQTGLEAMNAAISAG